MPMEAIETLAELRIKAYYAKREKGHVPTSSN